MIIKELSGHSGCGVFLCEENNKKYVRKISSSVQYNERLKSQMNKQAAFQDCVLKTPKIYKSGNKSGLFFFDMEFIGGDPFHNFVALNAIDNTAPQLKKILLFLKNIATSEADITSNVQEKIKNLKEQLPLEMFKYCEYCLNYDWSNIPISNNHGDLTFENILIYRNEIYLIDFLDSFVETKYIDYSKLLQDVLLMWSWRYNKRAPFIKNIYIYDRVMQNLTEREAEITKRFLILNLLRIIPYSDRDTLKFLEEKLQYIGNKYDIK